MTREEKSAIIEELKEKFENSPFFYITDSSTLTVESVNKLRGLLFEKGIEMRVVKNTLVKKALESAPQDKNYAPLMDTLAGPTALMFTEVANSPARVIKDFRKDKDKPFIKAAYIDSAIFIGDDKIEELSKLKSKEELVGEIIGLLQSPARNVISSLQSGGQTIMGLLKALEERG
ncbi:MAG: 50S ribosomal protein L10 [Lewinellaceae bacterium]|nr:50S ribosomal protein L10 [Lewinellaceae bacterium]